MLILLAVSEALDAVDFRLRCGRLLLNGSKIGDLVIISVNLFRVLFFFTKLDAPGLLSILVDAVVLVSSAIDDTLTFDLGFFCAFSLTDSSSVSSFKNESLD